MKKRMMKAAVVLTVAGSLISSGVQPAVANSGVNAQISDLKGKQQEVETKVSEKQSEITKLDGELKEIQGKIDSIRSKEAETEKKLAEAEEQLKKLEDEILELQEEIKILEERIEERKALIEQRAVESYQSGGDASYLEVLLGSQNFGDFVSKATTMTTIAEHDRDMLDEHIADEQKLQEMKAAVEEKKAAVEAQKQELEALKQELVSKREEMDKLRGDLDQKKQQLENELGEIISEEEILKNQEAALQAELNKQEEAASNGGSGQSSANRSNGKSKSSSNAVSSSSSSSSGGNSGGSSAPAASSAGFIHPAPGVGVYSGFGMRNGRPHNGVDFSSRGHIPIIASQSGTVSNSGYRHDYGNWITITHNVNGKQMTTLYAHLKERYVAAGESVSQGQTIGLMGSTGDSTGQHLHFEIHEGPFRFGASAVNPMKYL
ncbi:murein hydrolase activator EnvC family protein [Shouchella lonarensis]|nr:M23 family metallopeptidase [Shouchella lonarensis]